MVALIRARASALRVQLKLYYLRTGTSNTYEVRSFIFFALARKK
jgi:hypothetical protein